MVTRTTRRRRQRAVGSGVRGRGSLDSALAASLHMQPPVARLEKVACALVRRRVLLGRRRRALGRALGE
eukprot:3042610-Prymnesium_polylepis.2